MIDISLFYVSPHPRIKSGAGRAKQRRGIQRFQTSSYWIPAIRRNDDKQIN